MLLRTPSIIALSEIDDLDVRQGKVWQDGRRYVARLRVGRRHGVAPLWRGDGDTIEEATEDAAWSALFYWMGISHGFRGAMDAAREARDRHRRT